MNIIAYCPICNEELEYNHLYSDFKLDHIDYTKGNLIWQCKCPKCGEEYLVEESWEQTSITIIKRRE